MKKRIFIAVDISAEARKIAAHRVENLRREFPNLRVGWEKPEKLHLTLKFLGDAEEKQIAGLKKIVAEIASEIAPFNLRIAETGVFPSIRNARILWLDVKDERGNLTEINKCLETECAKIGFAKENRNFKPHLTIARLKEPKASKNLIQKHLADAVEPAEFEVAEIVIFESRLQPAGSIYQKLTTVQLKNQIV